MGRVAVVQGAHMTFSFSAGLVSTPPVVVLYHTPISQAVRDAFPEAMMISERHPGFKDFYTHVDEATGILPLGELLKRAMADGGLSDVGPVFLVGFSEGTQGVRTQLENGNVVAGAIAVDGIYTRPEAWTEIEERARAKDAFFSVTHSSMEPGTYKSTTQIAAELIAPEKESPVSDPGSGEYPMLGLYEDGFFRVVGYGGKDAAAHQFQAAAALPRELAIFRQRWIDSEMKGETLGEEGMSTGKKVAIAAGVAGVLWAGWQWYKGVR
jgi:hypothetical protein